jgi:hypothetical protein
MFSHFISSFVLSFSLLVSCEDFVHNPIQYHRQNPRSGSYNYGYDTGLFGSHSFHQENRDARSGQVRGRYGYTDPEGNLRLTHYTAGPQGFNIIQDGSSGSTTANRPTSSAPSYRTESVHHQPPHTEVHHVNEIPVNHNTRTVLACTSNKPPCPKGNIFCRSPIVEQPSN